jgi:glycosyltransferase involved in cell wall biosynthesis
MVLFLHNRYRTTGGEERVVDELLALVRDRLGEPAELLERDSAELGKTRAVAGLLRGGLGPRDVAKAVRLTGARVVHAHNLNPLFGWRGLAAARAEGARAVLHLHQYRLVCATGVCFTGGQECTRCHGRNTLPGVIHNCRGSRSEALAYGASLALWQRRLADQADAVIVPSVFARERLRELGAPLDFERVHVLPPPVGVPPVGVFPEGEDRASAANPPAGTSDRPPANRPSANRPSADRPPTDRRPAGTSDTSPADRPPAGTYALVVSRLAPEKGVDVAIDACRRAGVPLVIAGDGPELDALRARAGDGNVRFAGRVDDGELERLRATAALAIVPSRSAETFGLAAAEAMAVGVPVLASRIGALPELVDESALVEPGDASALAAAIGRLWGDTAAGEHARARVRKLCAPEVVADGLRQVYATNRSAGRRP